MTTDIMNKGKLSGFTLVTVTATTPAGETIRLIASGRMKQSFEFDSSRVYLNGTGFALTFISRPGKTPLIYRQSLNSLRFDLYGSGSGVNIVGASATAEIFRISNMDLSRYFYREIGF